MAGRGEFLDIQTHGGLTVEVFKHPPGSLALTETDRAAYSGEAPLYSQDAMRLAQCLGASYPGMECEVLASRLTRDAFGTHVAAYRAGDRTWQPLAVAYTTQDLLTPADEMVIRALEVPPVHIGTELGQLAAASTVQSIIARQRPETLVHFARRQSPELEARRALFLASLGCSLTPTDDPDKAEFATSTAWVVRDRLQKQYGVV